MKKNNLKQIKTPKQIRKRDGRIVDFDYQRVASAIFKAFETSGQPNCRLADELALSVVEKIVKKHKGSSKFIPTIEEIQDIVEETLIEKGFAKIAKAYILYREKRATIRQEKQQILDKKEIDEVDKRFDSNALRVLRSRYLRKDDSGTVVESPKELFQRVAIHVALTDVIYDPRVSKRRGVKAKIKIEKTPAFEEGLRIGKYNLNRFHYKGLYDLFKRFEVDERTKISWKKLVKMLKSNQFKNYESRIDDFYNLMVSRKFMPNTPALANFGNYLGMGSACFALGIEDSIDSIMDTLKNAAKIFKSGGGLGYNFSKLRPEGDYVKTTGGTSSGPLTFMRLFDTMTEVIKQGGIRRGANMGIMNSNHPDIEKFVTSKSGNKALKNFNISVLLMPEFWESYKKDKPYQLINSRTGQVVTTISARFLLDRIVYQAWESGEPGVIFFDRVNDYNPFLKALGPIVTTNPCGEVLLYPYESCNLGSINVWSFVKTDQKGKKTIDWKGLETSIKTATRFLDNIIDINAFPMEEIREMTLNTRKIGLGIMGVANLMYDMEIPFNSNQSWNLMEKLAEFINYYSKVESIEVAKEKGSFPYFNKSFYPQGKMPFRGFYEKKSWNLDWSKVAKDIKKFGLRNSYTTVIAPTGSISMIAGCSSGIEPTFSLAFEKNVSVGSFYYIDPVFERAMLREGLFDEDLVRDIVNHSGSVSKINYITPHFKKIFVTSHDITPEDHIKTLAAFQKWVDSSISKTNNFPADAKVEDMKKSYVLAYELGCKSVTVFRDKSIKDQVLVTGDGKKKDKDKDELVRMKDEKAEGFAVYRDPSTPISANDNNLNGNGNNGSNGKPTHCPNCKIALKHQEGCVSCSICGWGLCV